MDIGKAKAKNLKRLLNSIDLITGDVDLRCISKVVAIAKIKAECRGYDYNPSVYKVGN